MTKMSSYSKMRGTVLGLLVAAVIQSGCSDTSARADEEKLEPAARRVSEDPVVYQVSIGNAGDALLYDVRRFTVEVGSIVRLTLANTSSPAKMMLHNWLLVEPGSETLVAAQGLRAGYYRGWVPDLPVVLASTRALKPGERQTIELSAPEEPGDYPYLCTIPGHAKTMRGVMVVASRDEP